MKTINDLREAMFETLDALKSGEMTIEQAKAMAEVGQTIINSAKVEVAYIRAREDGSASPFLEGPEQELPPGVLGIRQYRIRG